MVRRSDYGRTFTRNSGQHDMYAQICLIREAAERLVRELTRAEEWTDGWSKRQLAAAMVDTAIRRCLATVVETGGWGTDNQILSHELWRIAGDWLGRGWLQSRIRCKPRHLPGDDELLYRIIDQTVCSDPLGRTFDDYFLKQIGTVALRDRSELIANEVSRAYLRARPENYHIILFGGTSGCELVRFLQQVSPVWRGSIKMTVIHQDARNLERIRLQLHGHAQPVSIVLQQENLFRIPDHAPPKIPSQKADFLICPGQLDYVTDAAAPQWLSYLYNCLGMHGRMLVGNFGPTNPTRAYWEWIANWYLHYRDEDSLRRVSEAAGIPATQTRVISDCYGVIRFLDIARGN